MHKRTIHENIIKYTVGWNIRLALHYKREFPVTPNEVEQITFHHHLCSVLLTLKEAAKQLISYSHTISAPDHCC